jgi:hypothetical protein
MSRQRIVFGAVLAVAFSAGLAACGGSSSETPPPLQPDPQGFHYAPPPPPVTSDDSDAGDAPRNVNGADDDDKPRSKASSTWGAGKAPTPH